MTERELFDTFPALARLSAEKRMQVYAHFVSAPRWLLDQISIVEFPADTVFIREGMPARDVYVVASGTPEEVAAVEGSYTGQYLKNCL